MMTSGTKRNWGGAVGQQQPSEMRQAFESAGTHDDRYEQVVAQRVVAGAIPDTNQPDQVLVSRDAIEALRVALASF